MLFCFYLLLNLTPCMCAACFYKYILNHLVWHNSVCPLLGYYGNNESHACRCIYYQYKLLAWLPWLQESGCWRWYFSHYHVRSISSNSNAFCASFYSETSLIWMYWLVRCPYFRRRIICIHVKLGLVPVSWSTRWPYFRGVLQERFHCNSHWSLACM